MAFADQMGTNFQVTLAKAFLAASRLALGELDTVPALCQEVLRGADRLARAVASRTLAEAVSLGTADLGRAEEARLES